MRRLSSEQGILTMSWLEYQAAGRTGEVDFNTGKQELETLATPE
jgi:hypothetical protein